MVSNNFDKMANGKKIKNVPDMNDEGNRGKVKFEVYGEEMVDRSVNRKLTTCDNAKLTTLKKV